VGSGVHVPRARFNVCDMPERLGRAGEVEPGDDSCGRREQNNVAWSTSTYASAAHTPANAHRKWGLHSVREFGEGRGGIVLETGDMSRGGAGNVVQAECAECGEDVAACLFQSVVMRCKRVESQGRG
jgi:hypothetical protein